MQAFERLSGRHVRENGLTHAQFDIIATLGNTPGMSYKELGERTLITKGTLTGVIERLEQKGLVTRERSTLDARSWFIRLTPQGGDVFRDVFPRVIARGSAVFSHYTEADYVELERALARLKSVIDASPEPTSS
ncbi:MarR family transcriptional regulator [Massilia sp. METH4]|uniref:MarR family winged helix-turn-helix transcriptional regulator n=1 Tax=Massilia sp. METH4 TaxID=3123041 RepID=UPI0030D18506